MSTTPGGTTASGDRNTWALARLRQNRVGIWTAALDAVSPRAAGAHAAELEDLGYGSLWFGEAYGREAFTTAGLLLSATDRLVVATGIATIYGRDAVTGNAASRTLEAAHPGRFIVGWGVSHDPVVQRLRGHRPGRPLRTMRAYLDAMDDAPFLAYGAQSAPPRVLAALQPAMLGLSATAADGAHTYLVTPDHTRTARAALGPDAFLCVEQAVVLTADRDEAALRAQWHLAIYTGLPNYRASWRRQGFTDEDFVSGGSRRLQEALVVRGDADTIAQRVREHLDAGADHVVVQALGTSPFDVPAGQWRALAPALARIDPGPR
ncbi:TIGR03620 family F420-dependent LLM class oxidoreductase [Plantactinospora sp. WMMB334]|uniref:TIGR03620 family F420-dependent LLM class oxidoreductase n=1 Tax=Plantactinospora sp. WMMB334 TaxID=3404119 RepID=UPI003B93431D